MPQRDATAYLRDIVDACDAIARFVKDRDYQHYMEDELLRSGVERQLFIVGEAVSNLRRLDPLQVHTLGDVQGIVDVRNILAHAYFAVKHDLIWDIVSKHAGRVRSAARAWLETTEPHQ